MREYSPRYVAEAPTPAKIRHYRRTLEFRYVNTGIRRDVEEVAGRAIPLRYPVGITNRVAMHSDSSEPLVDLHNIFQWISAS
jgi:hypothetical protein